MHDEEGFCRFMCIDYEQFIELTDMIVLIVSKSGTVMRKAIFLKQRFASTLRFLASGGSFRSLEYQFLIGRKAICYITDEVCKAIVTVLDETYLKFPSCQEDWKNIEKALLMANILRSLRLVWVAVL